MGPLPTKHVTSIYCNANSVTRVNGTPIYFETCPTSIYTLVTDYISQQFFATGVAKRPAKWQRMQMSCTNQGEPLA